MGTMADLGERIRAGMPNGMSQRQLAERAGMTPDALSRALNGQRGLSPAEVAAIARILGMDTHWLITGAPDPLATTIAARHAWDAGRRVRHNPGMQADRKLLDQIIALYRAAFPQGPAPSESIPDGPSEMRDRLGTDFVRTFADQVERELGIDVVRVSGLSTDYSLRVGSRGVIVLATQASWFRSNWSLAHELGHLALGHHSADGSPRPNQQDERPADRFAADLLISGPDLLEISAIQSSEALALMVWRLGVSTEALRNRLTSAQMLVTDVVATSLNLSTPALLRANPSAVVDTRAGVDLVTAREQSASARRFPLTLLTALRQQTELGAVSPSHLAWALDLPVDEIDFPEPDEASDHYDRAVADRPGASFWRSTIAGVAQAR